MTERIIATTWPGFLTEADVLYIQRIEMIPLTKETVSKKHLRILLALRSAQDEETEGLTYISSQLLYELISELALKSYPRGDLRSFAFELSLHGYIALEEDESYGTVYAITEHGTDFLATARLWGGSYLDESKSPNCYGVIQLQ